MRPAETQTEEIDSEAQISILSECSVIEGEHQELVPIDDDFDISGILGGNDRSRIKKTDYYFWTTESHERFLEGLELYGRDWKAIANYMGGLRYAQVTGHAFSYAKEIGKERFDQLYPRLKKKTNKNLTK